MSIAIVGRWGRSLAIRLLAEIAGKLSLTDGASVEMEHRDDELVIRKAGRLPSLKDLFRGKSPEEWREIYRDHSVDWGRDVGREVVEE